MGEHLQALFQMGPIDVAKGHHFRIAYLLKIGKMELSPGTGTYQADAYLLPGYGLLLDRRTGLHNRKGGEDYAGSPKFTYLAKK
jgi:hypothetical protein